MKKVPVTIITGFLGSGKTTLLKHILKSDHGYKIAVVQNELSEEMGIEAPALTDGDGELYRDIYELPNGCICCSAMDDFVGSINAILKLKKNKFDYIVVETTGVADPQPLIASFWVDSELDPLIQLDGVVTVIDGAHFLRYSGGSLDEIEEDDEMKKILRAFKASHVEEGVGDLCEELHKQVAYANIILVNKMDNFFSCMRALNFGGDIPIEENVTPEFLSDMDLRLGKGWSDQLEKSEMVKIRERENLSTVVKILRQINSEAKICLTKYSKILHLGLILNLNAYHVHPASFLQDPINPHANNPKNQLTKNDCQQNNCQQNDCQENNYQRNNCQQNNSEKSYHLERQKCEPKTAPNKIAPVHSRNQNVIISSHFFSMFSRIPESYANPIHTGGGDIQPLSAACSRDKKNDPICDFDSVPNSIFCIPKLYDVLANLIWEKSAGTVFRFKGILLGVEATGIWGVYILQGIGDSFELERIGDKSAENILSNEANSADILRGNAEKNTKNISSDCANCANCPNLPLQNSEDLVRNAQTNIFENKLTFKNKFLFIGKNIHLPHINQLLASAMHSFSQS